VCKIADTTEKTVDSSPTWKNELTGLYSNNIEKCSPEKLRNDRKLTLTYRTTDINNENSTRQNKIHFKHGNHKKTLTLNHEAILQYNQSSITRLNPNVYRIKVIHSKT